MNTNLLGLLAEQHKILEKTKRLETKYGSDFQDFEKKLYQQKHEFFVQWDDFIEWKSLNTALIELRIKIDDVEKNSPRF